jgi:hypothetical protein
MLQSTSNRQQQVKQGRWGKMSRGLNGRGPTRMQQHQWGYLLSLHRNYGWDCRIIRLLDGSVCERCPAVKFIWPHCDPSIHQRQILHIGPPYIYVCIFRWVPDTTSGHKLCHTDMGKSYQSPQARLVHNQAGLLTGQSDISQVQQHGLVGLRSNTTPQ